ncbi:MAG TPA: hypothetical protein DCP89_04735 [Acidimicrobiaceae bacterium]|nr:hypothetical protein [Acidimicrobiaceae bacterium]
MPLMEHHHEIFAELNMKPATPISRSVSIAASASDLWTAISDAGNLKRLHPFCERNEVERWPGPKGIDHIYYYSGVHYQRDVLSWHDGQGYDLMVGPLSGKISFAKWRIEEFSPNACNFSIEVTSYIRNDVSSEDRSRYETRVIKRAIPPYLDAVVQGVAYFVETGDPVTRNQFGAHEIYSPSSHN